MGRGFIGEEKHKIDIISVPVNLKKKDLKKTKL